jgi:hypothetical protein
LIARNLRTFDRVDWRDFWRTPLPYEVPKGENMKTILLVAAVAATWLDDVRSGGAGLQAERDRDRAHASPRSGVTSIDCTGWEANEASHLCGQAYVASHILPAALRYEPFKHLSHDG